MKKRNVFRRVIGTLLCVVLVLSGMFSGFGGLLYEVQEVHAAQGSGGLYENMYWEISDSGVMTLRPSGGRAYARIADNRYTNGTAAGGWPWKQYADKITEIKIQGTIGSSPNVDLKNMFSDLPNVTKIDISGFNFATDAQGNVVAGRHTIRNLDEMFANCPKLEEIVGLDTLAHSSVTSTQRMFKDCTALTTADFNALDMSNVTMAVGMFQNCSSLTELDLSNWTNNGKMQQMQDLANGCTSLKKFTLNNAGFETRVVNTATNASNYKATNASGAQTQRMFDNCPALEELDISNITISTWKGPGEGDGNQNTFVRSIGGTNSNGLPALKILKMNNIKLPGLKAGVLGGELVYHKESLEEFQFGGDIDIDDSINDSTHDAAYKSGLEEIVDKLIEGCRSLKVIDLSGWDTSDIKAKGAKTDGTYTTFGFKELIENGSLQKVIANDVTRADGSTKKTKIWMHYKDPVDDTSTTISEYDISEGLTPGELENLHIDWSFNFGSDDPIKLDNNPDDAHTLHGVLGGDGGYLGNGTYVVADPNTQPEPFNGSTGDSRIPKTYYLIDRLGDNGTAPKLFASQKGSNNEYGDYKEITAYDSTWGTWSADGNATSLDLSDYRIQWINDGIGGWRIFTREMTMTEWESKTSNDEATLSDTYKLKLVYKDAATDVNGKRHDVVVDINSVTFKDMDLIPTLKQESGDYVYNLNPYGGNPWGGGTTQGTDRDGNPKTYDWSNRQKTDLNSLAGTNPSTNQYDANQKYTRHLATATYNGLDFWNQMYKTTADTSDEAGWKGKDKLYSKGSGTYIDYDITIDDALPDTSVLFWVGDLDVAHSQDWDMSLTNPSQDKMLSDSYGPGSEGIVLGSGNDLATLTMANNTGLQRYNYDTSDYSQSTLNQTGGNYIVGTATDPNTSWSRFYVRADSQGSNYTWTSGISCKTTILQKTDIQHEDLPPVYVIPEAIKLVNGATPSGDFMDAFSFNLEKAAEISQVAYEYFYEDEENGENRTTKSHSDQPTNSQPDTYYLGPIQLDNLADDSVETRNNSYGVVPFSEREYQAPGSTQGSRASDHDPFGQHEYNEHIAKAYVYRITENEPENNSDGVMTYNKDRVVYYLKVIVSDPKTDLEMYKGTRADVTIGTYHYAEGATGNARFAPNDSWINWGETKTIWSSDATWTEQTTADGRKIFIDASGKKFYRNNGEFLSYPNDDQVSAAQYEQTAVTVTFDGNDYTVMQDKDGVRYIAVPDGSNTLYLDADNPDRSSPLREANADSVFPTEDDQPVAAEKQVEKDGKSYTVQIDVHGKTYIKVDDKYYAVTISETGGTVGDELTIEDATFNPHNSNRKIYENKTATLGGTSYVVKTDALGTEYFEVPGDPTSTYYKPDGTQITAGTAGSVTPSANDKAVTSDNSEGANFVVNGHTIYEDVNGVKYYTDGNGNYYSVLGTLLMTGIDVNPASDQPVKANYEIRQDAAGNLFYKGEGEYNTNGTYTTKYYNMTKNPDGTYSTDGSEYSLPSTLLDTSEAMVLGSFDNVVKESEIEIENQAEDGKAGTFTFEIEFDNSFEPTSVVFDPVTPLTDENDNPLQFEKIGDRKYKFTLTEGQKVTIKNVPFQTGYTVTKITESNGWEVTSADGDENAASIKKKVTQERYLSNGSENPDWDNGHIFVNRLTELVVKKVVDGIETDKEFKFTGMAKITGLEANEEFSYGYMQEAQDQGFKTAVANESGEASISLDAFNLQDQEDEEDIVIVLPKGAKVVITETPEFDYETTWSVDGATEAAVTDGATDEIEIDADKKVLTITNTYKATGNWYPLAYKILDGRPLERDQFEFVLTAGTAVDDSTVKSPLQKYEESDTNQLGSPLFYKKDKSTQATLQDGGDISLPVRKDSGLFGTDWFAGDISELSSRPLFVQDVETKQSGATYKDMGTGDVYGPVILSPITYVKEDLREQTYNSVPDWVKTLDCIVWTKDGTTYSSTDTIPSDATANFRVFTYTLAERQNSSTDYGVTTYDNANKTVNVLVAESTIGPLVVKAFYGNDNKEVTAITGDNPILFENEYLAKGEVQIKATKKMDGRDAFGRETFTGKQEFTFELTAVTENTPLPGTGTSVTKTIKPGAEGDTSLVAGSTTTAEIDFGTIDFTSAYFMNAAGDKFIATQNSDGLYERTFIYKITETTPGATDGNGMSQGVDPSDTTDTRASILVAVTVTEDKYGNLTVTRVNSADKDELDNDIYKNQNISLKVDNAGNANLPKGDGDYAAKSTVAAGTLYNTYQASGTAEIEATKVLENGTLKDNMFFFELVQLNKAGKEIRVINEKANKADGSIAFDSIVYNLSQVRKDAEGTSPICDGPNTESEDATKNEWIYKYLIRELVPDDATKADNITYDTTAYYAQVTVSDVDGDGILDTTIKYYKDAACTTELTDGIVFTNTAKDEAKIQVRKVVEGVDWDNNMNFWFKLTATGGTDADDDPIAAADVPMPDFVLRQATKDPDTVSWNISGYAAGTYNYTIQEVANMGSADPSEWSLDTAEHTVTVTVGSDGTVDVKYDRDKSNLTVTNTKKGNGRNIHATKKLVDSDGNELNWAESDSFTFRLTAEGTGAPMPSGSTGNTVDITVTDAMTNHEANFTTIMFDSTNTVINELPNGESITFTYIISEVEPSTVPAGFTYDDKTYTAKVTVSKDGSGAITVSDVKYFDGDSELTAQPTFTNKFDAAGELELTAKKVLEGANLSDFASDFKFTLYESDGTTVVKNKAGTEIKNITPSSDGTINLGTIAFDEGDLDRDADFTTKTYILKEAQGSYGTDVMTYDTDAHEILVKLTPGADPDDATKCKITAVVVDDEGDALTTPTTITNTYAPKAAQTFQVKKHLDDRPITRNGFDFTLEGLGTVDSVNNSDYAGTINAINESSDVPMPTNAKTHVGATTTNFRTTDTADFDAITYTMDNLKNSDGSYAGSRIFVYKITEDQGANNAIAYDTEQKTIYYAFIELTNNRTNGELDTKVTYVKYDAEGGTYTALDSDDELLFTNVYDGQGSATVTAIKQIIGRDWTEDDTFTFTVKPYSTDETRSTIGGGTNLKNATVIPVPGNDVSVDRKATGGNSATGTATIKGRDVGNGEHFANYSDENPNGFKVITYTDDMLTWDTADGILKGTFFYEITENIPVDAENVDGTKYSDATDEEKAAGGFSYDGFTYDSRSFYARVEVTDNRTGGLTTHVYYFSNAEDLDDISKADGATPVFQNKYGVEDIFEIPITKEIDGREWEEDDTFDFTIARVNAAPLPSDASDATSDDDTITINSDTASHTKKFVVPVSIEENLTNRTTSAGQLKYANEGDVPNGVRYGIFRYSITEKNAGETHAELTYQADPIYVEVQVVDDLSGGIDAKITYYSDSTFTTKMDSGKFTNIYDTYAENPAQILVRKEVVDGDGNEHTWASADTYSFTIEALDDAPTTRVFSPNHDDLTGADEQTTLEIKRDSSAKWVTSVQGVTISGSDVTKAATVSIPIKMSDLDEDASGEVIDTIFVYKISEQAGTVHGVKYNVAPIYAKITAKPQNDGTLKLNYEYFEDEACTSPYENKDASGLSGADGEGNGIVITNTFGATNLTVEKVWMDGLGKNADRPDIAIRLTQTIGGTTTTLDSLPQDLNGNKAVLVDKDGNTIEYVRRGVVAADKLPVIFDNLPAFTSDGTPITYSVTEDDPTGYSCTDIDDTTTPGKVTITNTLLTDIEIVKVWYDDSSDEANRPEAVVAGLTRGNASFPSRFTPVQKADNWQAEFSDLLAYDESGEAISYTISEMGIPTGYSARVEYSTDYNPEKPDEATWSETKPTEWDTQVTKYVRMVNTKLTDIEIEKTWVGGAASDVEFTLYRSVEPSDDSDFQTDTDGNKSWTPDETWEKVDSHAFASSLFEYVEGTTGDKETYTFKDLPAYNENGEEYTYRVFEPAQPYSDANQTGDLAITNTNKYDATGGANPTVVKELDGRPWLDSDTFYFMIEPEMTGEEGSEVEKITDGEGNAVTVEGVETPMPKDGDTEKPVTTVTKNSAQVGAIGRSVNFADISFTNEDMLNADGSTASVRNFYYRIYEVADADGTPLTEVTEGGVLDGITYAGTGEGDEWKPEVHTLRIEVTDNGDGTLSTNRYWDGATSSSAVPVFTNKYSSEGVAKIWVEKQIETRDWTSDDEFKFTITGISGASLNIGGSDSGDTYTTHAMSLADVADPEEDSVQLSDTVVAMGIHGNTYKGEALNNGDAYFIYSITEDAGDVSDLAYDQSTIYVRMHVEDNWDGTLKFTAQYFSDAACTNEITGHEVWIVDNGTEKRLLELDEIEEAEAMSDEELKGNGYRKVNAAHFINTTSIDIPVTKVWEDGPAVEDVTVHLLRALFPLDVEDELSDDYVKANVDSMSLGGWERVGLANTFQRGEFESETEVTHLVSGFNKALPMYVTVGGTTYRAVYMLTEDDTSDAYEPSYKCIQPDNSEKEGDNIFIDSGEMVITNKVIAGNQANIAAVKQLLGRQWLDEDDFSFSLEPYGKGTYNEDGTFKSIEETKDIPMPEDNSDRMSKTEADKSKATTHATIDTDVVDTEGNMERLARFGAIEYSVNDLEYDPTDRHHQGDFFYKMKEVVPAASSDGMTYSTKESIVHVKVRENRTDNLTVQIAYDEKTLGDIATGTQFTPVFTNRYEATAEFTASLDKYIMGRTWEADDEFDFTMNPLAGAPFEDADKSQFPEQDTHTEAEREAGLASGKAIHNAEGAHVIRMTIPTASVGMDDEITIDFPSIVFRLSELGKTADEGQLKYSDGTAVPKGMAYGQYMYAVEETKSNANDLSIDVDTEYVQVTVIDKGDGTLDLSSKIFEDRYAQVQRFEPDEDGNASTTLAKNVTFVNQLKRDLSVTKSWTDPANADVEMVLEWTTDNPASEASWNSAEGVSWLNGVTTTRVIKQTATGDDLTVTFKDLPAYQPDDDDLDLNNKWVYYRVVESTSGAFDTRYSEEAYESGKTLDDYSETPYYTEAEDADERVTELHVINFPNEVTGLAKVFVVKQLVGKDWTDESFNFVLTPIESKIGAETEAVPNSERALPMPAVDTATADSTTTPVGENEHNAVFGSIPISLSNLDVDPADGIAKGEFTYEVSEVIPSGQGDIKYTTDVHRVTITATNNGTGKVITSVSWDGREVGDFVPVYVNRWQPDTMSVSVRKVWDDANDQDGKRPEAGIAVKLLADGETALDKDGNEVTSIVLSENNNYVGTFENLPTLVDGATVEYTVEEINIPEGYDSVIEGSAADGFVITNTYTPETTAVTATKVWTGDDEFGTDLRADVTLHLYGKQDGKIVFDGGEKTITMDESGEPEGEAEWTELPKYMNGEAIEWTVTEEAVLGYSGSVEESGTDGTEFTVTNEFVGPSDSVTVTKVWDDDDDRDSKRPETVKYELYKQLVGGSPELVETVEAIETPTDETLTTYPGQTADWGYEWTNLPTEEEQEGTMVPVFYTVKEVYSGTELETNGYDKPMVETTENGKFQITNPRTKFDTTKINIIKSWDDEHDADGIRPEYIRVKVIDGTKEVASAYLTEENKGVSSDIWTYTIEGLPMNRAKGEPIAYAVQEDAVTGYTATITKSVESTSNGTYTIVNTHSTTPMEYKTVEATKVWKDKDGKELSEAPLAVTFHLVKTVEGYGPIRVSGEDKTIAAGASGDELTVKWENLPAMEGGRNVEYNVEEDAVSGYTGSVLKTTGTSGKTIVTVTNKETSSTPTPGPGPGPDPGQQCDECDNRVSVTYVDPFASSDSDMFKTKMYGSADAAKTAAESGADAPADNSVKAPDGYKFAGWKPGYDEKGNIIMVATYEKIPVVDPTADKTYIFVDGQTGEIIKSGTVEEDKEPTMPAGPSHDGMKFVEWTKIVDPVTGNVTYVAKYEPRTTCPDPVVPDPPTPVEKTHWVQYVDSDGTVYLEKVTIKDGESEPSAPANPTKDGFTFDGWSRTVDANGNVTYTAKWKENTTPTPVEKTHWVEYVDPDGTVYLERVTLKDGEAEPAPPATPSKDGYNFEGWIRTVDANGNITYTAKWEEIKPTPVDPDKPDDPTPEKPDDPTPEKQWVRYIDKENNIIYMDKTELDANGNEPPAPADPTRDGYVFDGWTREVDEDGNITYTANWKPESNITPTPTPEKPAKDVPKTGDQSNATLWIGILVLAILIAAIAFLVRMRTKK